MSDSPIEDRDRDGFSATRYLKVAWADRGTLRDELLKFPGHSYPHANISARCTGVGAKPFHMSVSIREPTAGVVITDHQFALVTARYETVRTTLAQPDPESPDPTNPDMISESLEPSMEAMALDGLDVYLDAGLTKKAPDYAQQPFMRYRETYTLVRHHLPASPLRIVTEYGDGRSINTAPFETKLLGMTFPALTVNLAPPMMEIVSDSVGNKKFTVTYRMVYQPYSWNHYPVVADENLPIEMPYRPHPIEAGELYWKPLFIRKASGGPAQLKVFIPRDFSRLFDPV